MNTITTKNAIALLQSKTVKNIRYETELGLIKISSIEFTDGTVVTPYCDESGTVKIDHIECDSEQLKIVHPYICPECNWKGIHEELSEYERVDGDGFYQGCPKCGTPEWELKSE